MSAIDDRRQRAREAAYDGPGCVGEPIPDAVELAIETATRVQVTPEIVELFGEAWRALNSEQARGRAPIEQGAKRKAGLIAAFRAAGFEVEE